MTQHKRIRTTPLPKGLDRLPSGNIRVRVLNEHGVQVTVGTFTSRASADTALAAAKTDIVRGEWIDPALGRITFGQLAEQVARYRAGDLAPRTQANNAALLKVLTTFTSKPVNRISVAQIDWWWAQHAERPVNRRNAYFLLRNVLNFGVRWGYIKTNPAMVEDAGAMVARRRPTHTVEEFTAVLRHLDPGMQRAMRVAFGAHLRISELAGLNIADYTPSTGVLRVEWQANAAGERVPTKTRNSKTVKVLQVGRSALAEQLQQRGAIGAAPIFVGPTGGRLRVVYIRQRWQAACLTAGIKDFNLHDIRHISLTSVAPGMTVEELKRRGGHRTAAAALIYQSASDERDAAMADAADARLQGLVN